MYTHYSQWSPCRPIIYMQEYKPPDRIRKFQVKLIAPWSCCKAIFSQFTNMNICSPHRICKGILHSYLFFIVYYEWAVIKCSKVSHGFGLARNRGACVVFKAVWMETQILLACAAFAGLFQDQADFFCFVLMHFIFSSLQKADYQCVHALLIYIAFTSSWYFFRSMYKRGLGPQKSYDKLQCFLRFSSLQKADSTVFMHSSLPTVCQ